MRNLQAAAEIVRTSEFFDPDWYVTQNAGGLKVVGDAALHYVRYGRRYGFEPGPRFSGQRYLERYPDVAAHDMDPLVHYLRYGRYENRVITGKKSGGSQPTATHRAPVASTAAHSPGRASIQAPAVRSSPAPSRKLGRKGLREQAEVVRNSKLFDETWYVDTHLEGVSPADAIVHYLTTGSPAGFDPGPSFSNRRYRRGVSGRRQGGHRPADSLHSSREAGGSHRLCSAGERDAPPSACDSSTAAGHRTAVDHSCFGSDGDDHDSDRHRLAKHSVSYLESPIHRAIFTA